jgi:hypothetical protein
MDIESTDRALNLSPEDCPGSAEVVWIYISPILSNKYALLGVRIFIIENFVRDDCIHIAEANGNNSPC